MVQRQTTQYPRLFLVSRWCSGEGEFQQRSRLVKPDGTTTLVEGQLIPIRLPGPEATATNVEIFLNVAFQEEGTHWVEVLIDGDIAIRYPLRVGIAKQQPGQPPPG